MKKTKPPATWLLASYVYINYLIWGASIIIVSQFHEFFMELWQTDLKGISLVISMLGLGHLLTVLPAGWFSDHFSRKATLIIGICSNIIFLGGLLLSRNLALAAICSLLLGNANSFNDSSSYPLLTELFSDKATSMNSLVKASISLGQMILPLLIAGLHNAYFILPILGIGLIVLLIEVKLTGFTFVKKKAKKTQQSLVAKKQIKQPQVLIDGLGLVLLGFSLSFIFYMFSQYAPLFAEKVVGLTAVEAKTLISWYAFASLVSVFITALVVRKVHPFIVLVTYTFLAITALGVMLVKHNLLAAQIASVALGFFAAGGLWQIGLTVLTAYFPQKKGQVTGYYSFAAALTYFVGPLMSVFILDGSAQSLTNVFLLDLIVSTLGFVLMLYLAWRCFKYRFL